jgi:DNA end-binding protein Ku
MVRTNMIALGRVTMHTRERLLAIEPRDNGLLATTLRMKDEVVNTAVALEDVESTKPDKQMIEIAEKIIEQLEGAFDPEEFVDRYEEALRDLVEEKKKGHKITRAREVETSGNVVDLMEALKKSLRSQPGRQTAAAPKKAVAKKKATRR